MREQSDALSATIILRSSETACTEFHRLFPTDAFMLCDSGATVTKQFGVHRSPFGLLYDPEGILVGKGIVSSDEDLRGLLEKGVVTRLGKKEVQSAEEVGAVTLGELTGVKQ
jgi:hypothetical protein